MNIISEIGTNDGGENAGYIRSLMIIKKNDIISLENPVFKANTGLYAITPSMLTLSDTAEIYKLNFVWRTCSWNETFNSSIPTKFENSIVFEISGSEAEARKFVTDNIKHEFVALFSTRSNQCFLIGNQDVGLELNIKNSISGKNFIAATLSGITNNPAFELSESDLDSFFGIFEFSEEFNLGNEYN
jgi:hypothetical protein